MAILFVDTSALIRRYDRREGGSEIARRLFRSSSGHTILISRITSVEVASAFNRKFREGRFDLQARTQAWRIFRRHSREWYRVITPDEATYRLAEDLLFAERLRAFDALQIAASLRAMTFVGRATNGFRFCTADQQQATAAANQGLSVEFIN